MSDVTKQRDDTPELLAPAGDWDCARAAVANGADAIYFGLQSFNARIRAANFTMDDLPALMRYLHFHGVRGFVTMNTLIFPHELEAAEAQLMKLEAAGVDAVIVQDLGLARLVREVAPSIELHASTQMTVTSPEGFQFLDSLFSLDRVVIARELSLKEIKKFPPEAPLEVFVHGALCVAYSGQCLTSESLGQRSANRGECAQACRMTYQLVVDGEPRDLGEQRYLLSPQDLAAVDLVDELVARGVQSFKIEGRLKSPDYVAAVTRVYRKAIDAALDTAHEAITERERYALEMTFSRGLSTGWLEGTNHPRLTHGRFGKKRGVFLGEVAQVGKGWISLQETPDVPLQADDGVVFDAGEDRNEEQGGRIWKIEGERLLFHRRTRLDWSRIRPGLRLWKTDDPVLNQEVRNTWKDSPSEVPGIPLAIRVEGKVGEPMRLVALEGLVSVASPEVLQEAIKRPLSLGVLREKLGRLGDSEYQLASLDVALEGDVMMPLSALNRLRRALVAALDAHFQKERAPREVSRVVDTLQQCEALRQPPQEQTELVALCRNMEQIEAAVAHGVDTLYIDFEDIRQFAGAVSWVRAHGKQTCVLLATPRIQKAGEAPFFKVIERAEPDGVLIRNLGAIQFFSHREDLQLVGDFSLNVANPLTAHLLREHTPCERLTMSYDLNISQVLDMLSKAPPSWFELTLHQHMPMFHMEHCVFCTFMSEGTSIKDCGKPCESHTVYLRDRVGQLHRLHADVGCRNTLYNGRAQTGARFVEQLLAAGLRRFRVEFLDQSARDVEQTLQAYQSLLEGRTNAEQLWKQLDAVERLGVTEGTLEAKRARQR